MRGLHVCTVKDDCKLCKVLKSPVAECPHRVVPNVGQMGSEMLMSVCMNQAADLPKRILDISEILNYSVRMFETLFFLCWIKHKATKTFVGLEI